VSADSLLRAQIEIREGENETSEIHL
jgi:hypothetical protein